MYHETKRCFRITSKIKMFESILLSVCKTVKVVPVINLAWRTGLGQLKEISFKRAITVGERSTLIAYITQSF